MFVIILAPINGTGDLAVFDSGRALSAAKYERVQALRSRDFRPLAATQV